MKVTALLCTTLCVLAVCSSAYAGAKDDVTLIYREQGIGYPRRVLVENVGDYPIRVIVEITIPTAPSIPAEYKKVVVEPGETVFLGCDKISVPNGCYFSNPHYALYRVKGAYYAW